MQVLTRPWGQVHYRIDGPRDGPDDGPLVAFANSLGTDLRLWDALLPLLPGIRALRFDKRGHGLSDLGGACTIADLADDAAALVESVSPGPVVFVGLSIGGMIAQDLAARRPDLVRALVLSNSAARMGSPDLWAARIAAVRAGGVAGIAGQVADRWFSPGFRASPEAAPWVNMLARTAPDGYIAACAALAAADLAAQTATLRLPALVIAGDMDGASPPDLVGATAALIPGAAFHVIPGTGHLPCVENPAAVAALLRPFLQDHAR